MLGSSAVMSKLLVRGYSTAKVTDKTFHDLVLKSKSRVTVVDFYADWCGPCRMLAPMLEKCVQEANKKSSTQVELIKMDVDHEQETSKKYEISALPTVVAFKNGAEVGRFLGLKKPAEIDKFIQDALSSK